MQYFKRFYFNVYDPRGKKQVGPFNSYEQAKRARDGIMEYMNCGKIYKA